MRRLPRRRLASLLFVAVTALAGMTAPATADPSPGDEYKGSWQYDGGSSPVYQMSSARCEDHMGYWACDWRGYAWHIMNDEFFSLWCKGPCARTPGGGLLLATTSAGPLDPKSPTDPLSTLCQGVCESLDTLERWYVNFYDDHYYIPVSGGTAGGNPHDIRVAAYTKFYNYGYDVAVAYPDEHLDCLTPGEQVVLCMRHWRNSYYNFTNPSVHVYAWAVSYNPDIYMYGTWLACHVLLPNDYYPTTC